MEEEIWKPIQGYDETCYEISSFGRVRNKNTLNIISTTSRGKNARPSICLHQNGARRHALIHRLVGIAFISNPNNFPEIDHIDRDVYNNMVSNLRWVTPSMNCQNRDNKKLTHNFDSGRIHRKVKRYDPNTHETKIFNSIKEGAESLLPINDKDLHTKRVNISACLQGKQKTCCGYIWLPIED